MITGMIFLEIFGHVPEWITINYMIMEAFLVIVSLFFGPRIYIPYWVISLALAIVIAAGAHYSEIENRDTAYLISAILIVFSVCKKSFEIAWDKGESK